MKGSAQSAFGRTKMAKTSVSKSPVARKPVKKAAKTFKEMTKSEKRVAIARDVLLQLRTNKYVPKLGVWVSSEEDLIRPGDENKQLQEVLKGKVCQVCAVGSVFVSAVRLFNRLKCKDAVERFRLNSNGTIYGVVNEVGFDEAEVYLDRFFSDHQIVLMEIAFEKGNGRYCFSASSFEYALRSGGYDETYLRARYHRYCALKFGLQYKSNTDRMKAIMKNIIRNKGEFRPPLAKLPKKLAAVVKERGQVLPSSWT